MKKKRKYFCANLCVVVCRLKFVWPRVSLLVSSVFDSCKSLSLCLSPLSWRRAYSLMWPCASVIIVDDARVKKNLWKFKSMYVFFLHEDILLQMILVFVKSYWYLNVYFSGVLINHSHLFWGTFMILIIAYHKEILHFCIVYVCFFSVYSIMHVFNARMYLHIYHTKFIGRVCYSNLYANA